MKRQYESIKEEIKDSMNIVLDSQRFIMGEVVEEFEKNITKYCNCKHAISVASGTDALLLAIRAYDISDEVLTSTFTFFCTAGAIYNASANPNFVEINPQTFNIDPEEIKKTLNKNNGKTKAVIPVHLYGKPAEMNEIIEIADDHDLIVIEDAAQTLGAEYRKKRLDLWESHVLVFTPLKISEALEMEV